MGSVAGHLSGDAADPDRVALMLRAAPHRGDHVRVVEHGCAAVGVSMDEGRADAVAEVVSGMAVAFVGSLDNQAALAAELELPEALLSRAAIPTILANLYRRHGADMPHRLRGVFAGLITDGVKMFGFRDHVGYRPLFYRNDESGFFAASEAKQVVVGAGIPREPDVDAVTRILYRNATDDTPSALRGVWRLPKSSSITARDGTLAIHRFWEPERLLETGRYSEDEIAARFDALFGQAVERTLTGSDVLSLSGGIDSPAIAAYAAPAHRRRFGRPLHATTVVYPRHPSVDESGYVRPLAATLGMPLHEYEQTADVLGEIDFWVRMTDGPYAAASLAHYAEDYRRARALGFTNVLTGEHAEYVMAMQVRLVEYYLTRARWGPFARELRQRHARGKPWPSLAAMVLRSMAPDPVKVLGRRLRKNRPSLTPPWVERRLVARTPPAAPWERWRRMQVSGFAGPGVSLEAEEVCQAVCGVTARRPWTDVDLWEFFLSLRAEQKFPDIRSKSLVRRLLRGKVPDAILDREDKTMFDEAAMSQIDYATLRRLLIRPTHRIEGVDYRLLEQRLEAGNLTLLEYGWARNLANVHAFLAQW